MYLVLVCGHLIISVRVVIATRAVYVLVDVLDFVIVLFQSGGFRIHIGLLWGGGLLCISAKRIRVRPENCFGRLKTELLCAISPCTTSLITGQYEMIAIELAELLSEWWFPLSTNSGRANQSKVGLHCCAGWHRGRKSNEMYAYRGVGVYELKVSSSASCPIFV